MMIDPYAQNMFGQFNPYFAKDKYIVLASERKSGRELEASVESAITIG